VSEPVDPQEALMQFLYRAPIGLLQTALDGTVEMINPMSASLLMPLSTDGTLDNLFLALDVVAPQFRQWTLAFTPASGQICESVRVSLASSRGQSCQHLSISLLKLDEAHLMAMIGDVTLEVEREERGMANRLTAASRTDGLTQMPNRAAVLDLIGSRITRATGILGLAVLFINVDRFKQINDSLGHATGDLVLKLMAERLRAATRLIRRADAAHESDQTAGRLGADEFVVVLDDVGPDETGIIAQRLLEMLSQPYVVGSQAMHCSVSIGAVCCSSSLADPHTVLQDASIAMVEAKRSGGARFVIFESDMHVRAAERRGLESDLRQALQDGQLFVVYQPVLELQRPCVARCSGLEALVRWRHPVRGVVPPLDFIGVAEECGLIDGIGEFVLRTACAQFMRWRRTLGVLAPTLLAVNLSRGQLAQPGFVDFVRQTLAATGLRADQLQLEVTESLAAQDTTVQARLRELKALGITLALDDFGTGYSSLASLHLLPVGTVKVDRSFVSEAVTSAHHRVLVEATVRVAKSLGMDTVAEGVETADQAALLRELGCDKGQGYFFSRPLAVEDLQAWLTHEQPRLAA
jgi:diguanylate cyclase (GGDEF)-like protein